jgi:hypothetical protein
MQQGNGHAKASLRYVQGVRAISVAPRVYCQALCSGFARLYEQRAHFSDVTLLANGVEARRPRRAPLIGVQAVDRYKLSQLGPCARVRSPLYLAVLQDGPLTVIQSIWPWPGIAWRSARRGYCARHSDVQTCPRWELRAGAGPPSRAVGLVERVLRYAGALGRGPRRAPHRPGAELGTLLTQTRTAVG